MSDAARDDLYAVAALLSELDRVLNPLALEESGDFAATPAVPPPLPPVAPKGGSGTPNRGGEASSRRSQTATTGLSSARGRTRANATLPSETIERTVASPSQKAGKPAYAAPQLSTPALEARAAKSTESPAQARGTQPFAGVARPAPRHDSRAAADKRGPDSSVASVPSAQRRALSNVESRDPRSATVADAPPPRMAPAPQLPILPDGRAMKVPQPPLQHLDLHPLRPVTTTGKPNARPPAVTHAPSPQAIPETATGSPNARPPAVTDLPPPRIVPEPQLPILPGPEPPRQHRDLAPLRPERQASHSAPEPGRPVERLARDPIAEGRPTSPVRAADLRPTGFPDLSAWQPATPRRVPLNDSTPSTDTPNGFSQGGPPLKPDPGREPDQPELEAFGEDIQGDPITTESSTAEQAPARIILHSGRLPVSADVAVLARADRHLATRWSRRWGRRL